MGFQLFNKSGTFSPSSLGLSPGDIVNAIVVGGGGGGAASYISSNQYATAPGTVGYKGGNGGPSSFGSYATALGGGGGICDANVSDARLTRSTQGGAFGGIGTVADDVPIPGGGAGGWLPDDFSSLADGGDALAITTSADVSNLITLSAPISRGAPGGLYVYTTNAYLLDVLLDPTAMAVYKVLYRRFGSYSGVHLSAMAAIFAGIRGGVAGYGNKGNDDIRCGRGGRGYGAGGGSVAANNSNPGRTGTEAAGYTSGGNAGEIKIVSLTLANLNNIAVTVGGGGSGAAAAQTYSRGTSYARFVASNYGAGNNGAAGSAGAARAMTVQNLSSASEVQHTYGMTSGRGGYGDSLAGDATTTQEGGNPCACGGGGAGGCVAVFW